MSSHLVSKQVKHGETDWHQPTKRWNFGESCADFRCLLQQSHCIFWRCWGGGAKTCSQTLVPPKRACYTLNLEHLYLHFPCKPVKMEPGGYVMPKRTQELPTASIPPSPICPIPSWRHAADELAPCMIKVNRLQNVFLEVRKSYSINIF